MRMRMSATHPSCTRWNWSDIVYLDHHLIELHAPTERSPSSWIFTGTNLGNVTDFAYAFASRICRGRLCPTYRPMLPLATSAGDAYKISKRFLVRPRPSRHQYHSTQHRLVGPPVSSYLDLFCNIAYSIFDIPLIDAINNWPDNLVSKKTTSWHSLFTLNVSHVV
jgi:hypothetical protein